jgi:phosphoglycerate-specific signal transduction histidine kinase
VPETFGYRWHCQQIDLIEKMNKFVPRYCAAFLCALRKSLTPSEIRAPSSYKNQVGMRKSQSLPCIEESEDSFSSDPGTNEKNCELIQRS